MRSTRPSFFSPVPERDAVHGLFEAYMDALEARNGPLKGQGRFSRREGDMVAFDEVTPTRVGAVDPAAFQEAYVTRAPRDCPEELLALLCFTKLNAAEAYAVEVAGSARAKLLQRPQIQYRVEEVTLSEETYHTRLLMGVANHYGLEVGDGWTPAWPVKLLIFCLAKAPPSLFHPILLGSEVGGVFMFNWMLNRVGELFRHAPEVRESMEQRLMEVMIDEVGHIAYNRLMVGNTGVRVARSLAAGVVESNEISVPELVALGLDSEARKGIASFDYLDLPDEVRRRAFFV